MVVAVLSLACQVAGVAADQADPASIGKAEAVFKSGCKAAEKKEFDQAEKLFQQAVGIYPLLPGAYVELGKICMAKGRTDDAIGYYERGREAYVQLHHEKAKQSMKRQQDDLDFVTAGKDAEVSTRGSSFAKQYGQQSKEDRMEQNRRVVVNEGEADIPALFYLYLGAAYLKKNRLQEAEDALKAGSEKDPKLAPIHFNLSVLYLMKQQYPDAVEEARAAKKLGFPLPEPFVKDLESRSKQKM